MCDVIIPVLSMAAGMASQAVGMVGRAHQANTQANYAQAQLNAEAQMAANQQAVANQQARMEIQKGITERDKYMRQAKAKQSESVSMMAAGGFEMDSGSNLSMLSDQAKESQHEANIITQNAETGAWGHMINANNALNRESMLKAKSANKKVDGLGFALDNKNSFIGMGDSLLSSFKKDKP